MDPSLDPHFAYAQVLAGTVGEHGILDVLSATRASRLAILELKTVEHPVFLMQGAKYWLRVKRHLELENFPSLRFFPWPPDSTGSACRVFSGAGALLSSTTEILPRYLNPQMQVVRVGLAESWRSGLSVILRQ